MADREPVLGRRRRRTRLGELILGLPAAQVEEWMREAREGVWGRGRRLELASRVALSCSEAVVGELTPPLSEKGNDPGVGGEFGPFRVISPLPLFGPPSTFDSSPR